MVKIKRLIALALIAALVMGCAAKPLPPPQVAPSNRAEIQKVCVVYAPGGGAADIQKPMGKIAGMVFTMAKA